MMLRLVVVTMSCPHSIMMMPCTCLIILWYNFFFYSQWAMTRTAIISHHCHRTRSRTILSAAHSTLRMVRCGWNWMQQVFNLLWGELLWMPEYSLRLFMNMQETNARTIFFLLLLLLHICISYGHGIVGIVQHRNDCNVMHIERFLIAPFLCYTRKRMALFCWFRYHSPRVMHYAAIATCMCVRSERVPLFNVCGMAWSKERWQSWQQKANQQQPTVGRFF